MTLLIIPYERILTRRRGEAERVLVIAFAHQLAINFARVVVGLPSFGKIRCGHTRGFLRPALIYGIEAPFGARARAAHGLAADDREYRVRVRGGQRACGDPTAFFYRDLEFQVADFAVRHDCLARYGLAVDNDLDRHFTSIADA